jgi:predicted metal-dependent hydrolase
MTVARQTPRPTGGAASPSDRGPVSEAREVALAGGLLAYLVRRSPRARRLRVTLDPRRGVIVTVPGSARRGWSRPEPAIEAFLADRERWIRRHLDRYARERAELAARGGVTNGASIRYRGDLHRLRILADHQAGAARTTVMRVGGPEGDELVVRLATGERRPIETILRDALVARARMAVQREIERHASALDVRPVGVGIRDPRTRWGSASRAGRLSFSWRLVLAPPEALETVVVHELAHLRVFGHGPRFWSVVASRRPDHATWRRWLRDHSVELHGALEA